LLLGALLGSGCAALLLGALLGSGRAALLLGAVSGSSRVALPLVFRCFLAASSVPLPRGGSRRIVRCMADKPRLQPGAGHPITVSSHGGRVVVRVGGTTIADTRAALTLREADYPAVQYIPREDVDMSLLSRTSHATYCPYKGDAAYFTINANGTTLPDSVWTYEQPYDAVAAIKDHVAFYTDRVELTEQD
jgi:uncharacterized protein (DUF427 family)